MATFYHCKQCECEFLGHDELPDDEFLLCDRCNDIHRCGICGDFFRPIPFVEIAGVTVDNQTDYCEPCYARECMPIEEEMALDQEI